MSLVLGVAGVGLGLLGTWFVMLLWTSSVERNGPKRKAPKSEAPERSDD